MLSADDSLARRPRTPDSCVVRPQKASRQSKLEVFERPVSGKGRADVAAPCHRRPGDRIAPQARGRSAAARRTASRGTAGRAARSSDHADTARERRSVPLSATRARCRAARSRPSGNAEHISTS
jgi:hypothetical protein